MTNHYIDLKNSDCILIMGSNMAEHHPIAFKWVTRAKEKGATIIHVDPRYTRTSACCHYHVPLRSGTDIAFLGGMINYIIANGKWFKDYVLNYTNASFIVGPDYQFKDGLFSGYDKKNRKYNKETWVFEKEASGIPKRDMTLSSPRCVFQLMKKHYSRYDLDKVSSITGVSKENLLKVYAEYSATGAPDKAGTECYALGWTHHTTGSQIIRTMSIIQLLLGNMGIAGGGVNALRGEPELFQATLVRRDGFSVPAELLCKFQDFQGRPALIMSARNITGRLRAQAEIERRLELEALAAAVSGRLINTGGEDLTAAMEQSLADLCAFSGMRRAAVYLFDPQCRIFTLAYQWREPDMPALPERLRRVSRGRMPWLTERIAARERVFIRNTAHMPPAGRKEKLLFAEAGLASLAAVPMSVEDRLLGALILASDTPQDAARLSGSALLEQVTLLFANAIERRNAGAALRESESLARAILDALPANICVMNTRGQLTMVNRAWAATGSQSTPLCGQGGRLGLGDNYLEACRRAEGNPFAAQTREGILAVLSGRTRAFRLEYPGQVAGDSRWFVLQVTPFARGKRGAVASHRDITERMRAVTELRESEERFRIIVETAQEGVLRVDTALNITYANPRTCAMLGYSAQELLGRPLTDVLDPLDHPLLQQKIKRRIQGLADQYELRFRHRSGHRIWTVISASPVRDPDGAVVGSIGMVTDISDRVRAEAKLRRNEARYRSLVESLHEGLIMTRKNGVVSYVNDRFCAMLGRSRGEFTGQLIASFAEESSRERLERLLSASHAGGSEEILWEHGSGRHVYSLVSPSTFADEEGKPAGFFAVVTDTTERKSLESQLLQSQKMEAIGQLAAGIAHEINTPAQYVGNNVQFIKGAFEDISAVLAATRALTESAKTACPGPAELAALERLIVERDIEYLSDEVPGAIAQTLEGVERISTIVRSVKQFAHPGAAAMAPADLNESMKSTATVSRNEWKYVAELDLDLDPGLPLVVCMIGEINQVVLNLIINAAHAIADAKKLEPGREGRITLSTRLAKPWAEIRVADTGTGIPAAVQARIFDPFFTTKEVGRGTGQGLTISRTIVMDKHRGQLFFETQEGRGTTFVVRLPLDPPGGGL